MANQGTTFEFVAGLRTAQRGDVLLVPLISDPEPPMQQVHAVDLLCDGAVSRLRSARAIASEAGQLAHTAAGGRFPRVVVASLGPAEKLDGERLRSTGRALATWLTAQRLRSASLWIDGLASSQAADPVGEVTLGMMLAGFAYQDFRAPDKKAVSQVRIDLRSADRGRPQPAQRAARHAATLAGAVNFARWVAHQPPNVLHPPALAGQARALAKSRKLKCTVLEGPQLKRMNMGGLLAVGGGAGHPPCLIRLDYAGAPRARAQTVLVGKSITFDTGGYSIKPAEGMEKMKFDMCGGAAVLGTMRAVADLKLKCNVVGILAAAENAISSRSYRPGDILRMASGKTVEVTNTDAEGRLVLADALWYAQERCRPAAVIDLATLTGGVVIALGAEAAGLMSTDDELAAALEESGRHTRERLWRLPLWDEYRELIKSRDADLRNSAAKRQAHAIVGGMFLKEFIRPKTAWAHLDIAGVAYDDNAGASGFGVRLLVDYLQRRR